MRKIQKFRLDKCEEIGYYIKAVCGSQENMEQYRSGHNGHDWKSCVPQKGTEGSNPSCSAKKERSKCFVLFLSKPQAWHIIAARSAVHIISPGGAVSHRALACISLRLDDIQTFGLMIYRNRLRMIYKACALIYFREYIIINSPKIQDLTRCCYAKISIYYFERCA